MAINKKEEFKQDEIKLADFAKAISHPARIAILKTLAERESCVCGEIVAVLPLAQSTVSQHLKELREVGIIKGTVDGPKSCYCINWEVFGAFATQLNGFFVKAQAQKGKLCC